MQEMEFWKLFEMVLRNFKDRVQRIVWGWNPVNEGTGGWVVQYHQSCAQEHSHQKGEPFSIKGTGIYLAEHARVRMTPGHVN